MHRKDSGGGLHARKIAQFRLYQTRKGIVFEVKVAVYGAAALIF
jgi:hypothetical protein